MSDSREEYGGDGGVAVPEIRGLEIDPEGRCRHWHGPTDVVAIQLPCCDGYFACHACHDAIAGHPIERWPRDRFDAEAVLCGACGETLTISAYLEATACPACDTRFNPRCALHHPIYFDVAPR